MFPDSSILEYSDGFVGVYTERIFRINRLYTTTTPETFVMERLQSSMLFRRSIK